ncbi:MAG: TlpA disulfide reductase family protein [Pyrinomonadaceae bacterium]
MKNLLLLAAIFALTLSVSAQKPVAPTNVASQPTFAALGMDGQRIDMAALRGKVVVLNLWFINCPNCLEEITSLNQLVDQYKDNKDIVFLALAASRKADLEKFLKKHPFKYQVVPDASMIILSKFGTPDKNGEINIPFPMHYVLDREGNIVLKMQGVKGVDAVTKELRKQFSKPIVGSN